MSNITDAVIAAQEKMIARPGRPVDPNSPRQQRLKEIEARREKGGIQYGRPVDPNSAKQRKLAILKRKQELGIGGPGYHSYKLAKMVEEGKITIEQLAEVDIVLPSYLLPKVVNVEPTVDEAAEPAGDEATVTTDAEPVGKKGRGK